MITKSTLIFDIETNGLFPNVSTIHCIAIKDLADGELVTYNDQGSSEPIVRAVTRLEEADWIIGHNIINYDIPVIQKIYPFFTPPGTLDTLLLSKLRFPHLKDLDFRTKPNIPLHLYGSHGLKAWGLRLGNEKDSFGETSDWSTWSQELEDYMAQDVSVTTTLWHNFRKSFPGLP